MIYIIISNIGLAIMTIIVYTRYSALKISSGKQIRELYKKEHDLCKMLNDSATEKKSLEDKLMNNSTIENYPKKDKSNEDLLREIDQLRKEKEVEIRARLEVEKKSELALQKMEDIQKRMDDWRIIQDSVMKDSRDAILKVGDNLYKKIHESHQHEVELVSQALDKFNHQDSYHNNDIHHISVENISKKLVNILVSDLNEKNFLEKKDYFLPADFNADKSKMLCELLFVDNSNLNLIDLKASHYFDEYHQLKQKKSTLAENFLKQKLERYWAYVSNPKYQHSIEKLLHSKEIKFSATKIIIAVNDEEDLKILENSIHYEKTINGGFIFSNVDKIKLMLVKKS
jgi:hypothetical protein